MARCTADKYPFGATLSASRKISHGAVVAVKPALRLPDGCPQLPVIHLHAGLMKPVAGVQPSKTTTHSAGLGNCLSIDARASGSHRRYGPWHVVTSAKSEGTRSSICRYS